MRINSQNSLFGMDDQQPGNVNCNLFAHMEMDNALDTPSANRNCEVFPPCVWEGRPSDVQARPKKSGAVKNNQGMVDSRHSEKCTSDVQ